MEKRAISYQLCRLTFPASPVHFCVFVTSILEGKGSHYPARTVTYAIYWVHKIAGMEPPLNYPLVKWVINAGHRIYSEPLIKKEPIEAITFGLI